MIVPRGWPRRQWRYGCFRRRAWPSQQFDRSDLFDAVHSSLVTIDLPGISNFSKTDVCNSRQSRDRKGAGRLINPHSVPFTRRNPLPYGRGSVSGSQRAGKRAIDNNLSAAGTFRALAEDFV